MNITCIRTLKKALSVSIKVLENITILQLHVQRDVIILILLMQYLITIKQIDQ